MLRAALALAVAAAACTPHAAGTTTPLVEPPPAALPAAHLQLPAGEAMEWDIYWQGLLVGHADLDVGPTEAQSRFATTALARTFAKVRYHLITTLDGGVPVASREAFELPGEDAASVVASLHGADYALDDGPHLVAPGGAALHTLHTAIGSLRTWSRGDATPAYLWFVLRHTLYRLDVTRPTRDEAVGHRALLVRGTVRALDGSVDPIDVTIWLAATPDRTPLRFVVVAGGERVSAELTQTTAKL